VWQRHPRAMPDGAERGAEHLSLARGPRQPGGSGGEGGRPRSPRGSRMQKQWLIVSDASPGTHLSLRRRSPMSRNP
jgi:hypothetical protein